MNSIQSLGIHHRPASVFLYFINELCDNNNIISSHHSSFLAVWNSLNHKSHIQIPTHIFPHIHVKRFGIKTRDTDTHSSHSALSRCPINIAFKRVAGHLLRIDGFPFCVNYPSKLYALSFFGPQIERTLVHTKYYHRPTIILSSQKRSLPRDFASNLYTIRESWPLCVNTALRGLLI